jgi:hypothetical protein
MVNSVKALSYGANGPISRASASAITRTVRPTLSRAVERIRQHVARRAVQQ